MTTNARQNGYAPPASNYKGQQMAYNGQGHGAQYLPRGLPMSPNGDTGLQGLTNTMAALNMQASYGSSVNNKSAGSGMSANSSDYGAIPMSQGQGLWIPNQHPLGSMYQQAHSAGMYNHNGAFEPQSAYQYGQAVVGHSPMAPGWASRMSSGDMPSLLTPRRDSVSSNENDIPGTPFGSGGMYRYGAGATIMDRSPSAVYTNSATPSPSQLAHGYQLMAPVQKQQSMPTLPPHLLALVHQAHLTSPLIGVSKTRPVRRTSTSAVCCPRLPTICCTLGASASVTSRAPSPSSISNPTSARGEY
jgi:hypothetical protein